ncbi:MAG: chemotaxis protein CheW [Candidatus Cloacimonetes bacterium]|nr:chemotaxis protein CheW [Candidatus Cloacimonadota bacterium]
MNKTDQTLDKFLNNAQEVISEILAKEAKVDENIVNDVSTLMFLYHQVKELLSYCDEYESLRTILKNLYNSFDRFTMMDEELVPKDVQAFLQNLRALFAGLRYIIEQKEYFEFFCVTGEQTFKKIQGVYDLTFELLCSQSNSEDFYDFIEEANQLLEELNDSSIDELDLDYVFRVIHTIKGTSSFLDELHDTIHHLCHEFESYIAFVIEKSIVKIDQADESCIRRLLMVLRIILTNLKSRLDQQNSFNESVDLIKILTGLQNLIHGESISADELYQVEELSVSVDHNIRVSALYMDQLSGGMEAFQIKLGQFRKQLESDLYLFEEFQKLQNSFFSLQSRILDLRLFAIEPVFKRFARQIEEYSKTINKSVAFQLSGLETKIDRKLSEVLIAPLTHIVRNAISHGIEDSDERVFIGKEAQGNIGLSARSNGKNVVIEISDDGRGIDLDIVKQQAIQSKLVEKDSNINDQDLYNLLFTPGFSTSEVLTEVSGRGVGLDSVKVDVERIGGKVELSSVLGEGTTFRLVLPLTITSVDCLLFEVNQFVFTIPMGNILAVYDYEQYNEKVLDQTKFRYRSKVLRLIDLGKLLFNKGVEAKGSHVLILEGLNNLMIAVIVSKIVSKDNLLLRPIDHPLLKDIKIASSMSILKTGRVATVLDVSSLDKKASSIELNKDRKNV